MKDYNLLIQAKKEEVEKIGNGTKKINQMMKDAREIGNSLVKEIDEMLPSLILPFEKKAECKGKIEKSTIIFANRVYLIGYSLINSWLVIFGEEKNKNYLQVCLLKEYYYKDMFSFPSSVVIDDEKKNKDTRDISENVIKSLFQKFQNEEFLKDDKNDKNTLSKKPR
jgi:hypothetical protein